MPEHYSPKHVLQPVPYDLPREFFARRAALEIAPDEINSTPIHPIYYAWHHLPGEQRADAERWFGAVLELGGSRSFQSALQHEVPAEPGVSALCAQPPACAKVVRVS